MITDFANETSTVAKLSLEMLTMQHNLHVNNIANVNTANYYKTSIEFSDIYDEINNLLSTDEPVNVLQDLGDLKDKLIEGEFIKSASSDGVDLDTEMLGLSKNTIMYKTLISALSSRSEIMKIAILGNNGK